MDPAQGDGSGEFTSPFTVVCNYWKEFDLESMRNKLDDVGLKIAELQEEAVHNRKKLAESTRKLKRDDADAITTSVGGLLRQYQDEIDRLTKRAKHGESAFLELYQKLFDAPDPAPILQASLTTATRAAELEAMYAKTSQELSEYKAESLQIKNQDLTIRKLEEKVRHLEAQVEERERQVVEAKQAAVAEADAAVMAAILAREQQLAAMLAEAQSSLATAQAEQSARENLLFAIQSQSEDERASRQSELDLSSQELERAQERLMALENEKRQLMERLDGKKDSIAAVVAAPAAPAVEDALRAELSSNRELVGRLRSEVSALRWELEESCRVWEARHEGGKAALAAQEAHSAALEQQLSMRPSAEEVESLKAQIRVLQAVGYNAVEGGEEGSSLRPGSMESLLLQKNRHLEHQLTMGRLKTADAQQQLEAAAARVADLETALQDQQRLVQRLEEDLVLSRQAQGRARRGAAGGKGDDPMDSSGEEEEAGGAGQGESSMLRVVCGQRDRLRNRVSELEEEVAKTKGELAAAKGQLAASRADNMALVERMRYVQGYKRRDGDLEAGSSEVEKRYGRMYDEKLNPFNEFKGREKEKHRKDLNIADRAMYMLGQLIFGNQAARLGAFVYLVCVHLLVFFTISRMTHHSSNQLYQHQQDLLGQHRHDVTALLHHEHPAERMAASLLPPGGH